MIRRFPVAVASLALAVTVSSGCGTFTDNRNAASVDDTDLAVDDVPVLVADLALLSGNVDLLPDDRGELQGDSVRQAIAQWIDITAVTNGIVEEGSSADQATRDTAASDWQTEIGDPWATLSPLTQSLLTDIRAAATANAESIYNAGSASSGVLCIRIILTLDEASLTAATDQLEDGTDFATIADSLNPPDLGIGPGGALVNQDGSECTSAAEVPAEVGTVAADLAIGEPSGPIPVAEGQYVFILQRPFDEVSDSVQTMIGSNALSIPSSGYLDDADIRVDSRYGMWVTETQTVDPTR